MKYALEIVDMNGDCIADAAHSLLDSDTPIPIPNVGEEIYFAGGEGPAFVKVVLRRFTFSPTTSKKSLAHVQVFCEPLENK